MDPVNIYRCPRRQDGAGRDDNIVSTGYQSQHRRVVCHLELSREYVIAGHIRRIDRDRDLNPCLRTTTPVSRYRCSPAIGLNVAVNVWSPVTFVNMYGDPIAAAPPSTVTLAMM